jgi:hypothetical protein
MTTADEDLLTTTEGVDEGSAASAVEGPGSGSDAEAAGIGPSSGGPRDHGVHAFGEAQPAPPVDVETDESRAARAADTGQQLQAGEG